MATSGSFNTNKVDNFYFTVSWSRTGYNATKNEHYISYKVVAHNTAGKYRNVYTKRLTINGTVVYNNSTTAKFYDGDTVTSGNRTIPSSNSSGDGSLTILFEAGVGTSSVNCTGNKTWSLDRIPRYATSNQTVSSKTETSITMNWSSDSTIDYIWYSINNGSSWTAVGSANATSGNYTISGLSANTTYNIKTRVRRKDSQLTTDSSNLAVATYAYPYANSMPNFTIGNLLTIGIYNPLKRSVQIYIVGSDNTEYGGDTIAGTSISGYYNSVWQNWWYSTIPNSKSGTYKVKVIYGNIVTTKNGGTYSVNENECIPETGTLTYQDTNASTIAITGNNQLIIQNNSTLQITISNAEAIKSANLATASANINGVITSGNFAAGSNTLTLNIGAINVSSNLSVPITVTDSRGISSTKNLEVQILSWSLPTAIINLARVANYYTTTDLTVNADYSSLNNNNTITIQYQIKKVTDATYSQLVTIQDNVQTQFEADNLYEWDIKIILTDRLGSTTYNLKLAKGIPIAYFDSLLKSTGFNCFPKDEESVEVNGVSVNKNIITASILNNYTLTTTSNYEKLQLDTSLSVGNKLTLDNNSIVIGSNVSIIKISAKVSFNSLTNGLKWLGIQKNSDIDPIITNPMSLANRGMVYSTDTLVEVQENDEISLVIYGIAGDVIKGSSVYTNITIEVVK